MGTWSGKERILACLSGRHASASIAAATPSATICMQHRFRVSYSYRCLAGSLAWLDACNTTQHPMEDVKPSFGWSGRATDVMIF